MRVSLITLGSPDRQTGGYLYHRRLARAAPEHGAEMSFVSFPDLPFPLPVAFGRGVVDRADRADIVVVDSIVTAFAAPWLRRPTKPVVGMLHQSAGGIDHGPVRTRVQARLDRIAYPKMRALLVASESLASEFRSIHPDVRLVAPGRDVAKAAAGEHQEMRRGRAAAFVCVGNWVERKGIAELLDAFAQIPDRCATLHLVGDDAVDHRYARRVRARLPALGDRVVVHGVVPPDVVAAMYRDADAFVMPSYREPYGTVYGEAMAAGLPVVGWRAGNLPYLADDGREGLIVKPGDTAALAAAMRRLAEDTATRKAMGEAARKRSERFPTWESTAARFFAQLREVTART